jgi:hypothetical protein
MGGMLHQRGGCPISQSLGQRMHAEKSGGERVDQLSPCFEELLPWIQSCRGNHRCSCSTPLTGAKMLNRVSLSRRRRTFTNEEYN